ncbi:MAG: hypothetical protein U0175_23545 [Caldilineaceae bacterium]
MTSIELIVHSLAAGIAAQKQLAHPDIVEANQHLQNYIETTYETIDLGQLRKRPESLAKRQSLAEDFEGTGADNDSSLLRLATNLTLAVLQHAAQSAEIIAVDLNDVQAELIKLSKIKSSQKAVRGRNLKAKTVEVDEVEVGEEEAAAHFEFTDSELGALNLTVNTGKGNQKALAERYLAWVNATLNHL